MKNELLEKIKEKYKKDASISILRERDWEVVSERYAQEFSKIESSKLKKEIERLEKVNEPYGHFFDRVISDGEEPDRAAMDLGLI